MTTFNTFSPLQASALAIGRSAAINQSIDAAPQITAGNFSTLMRNQAYARLDANTLTQANPDFATGAAGRIITSLTEASRGNDPRISRGYIRRSSLDTADPTSSYRLYFMYNPETIQRQYVSYLDQQALDPFNTIFGSNNLVAPPGILDFSFDMFFDRQVENANGSMPRGVLEDFDYFDLVVRGVVPNPQQPDLPDNGIMMINPRNITVVFSPQLSVQGRPNSAAVQYLKFDHNMRPVRMQISIGMKAVYIGPVRADFTFSQAKEEGTYKATIPYEQTNVQITFEDVKYAQAFSHLAPQDQSAVNTALGAITAASGPQAQKRADAVSFAEYLLGPDGSSPYNQTRPVPTDPKQGLDCSGLIFWAYRALGMLSMLGFDTPYMNGNTIRDNARRMGNIVCEPITQVFLEGGIQRGDVFVGDQHVAWCAQNLGGGRVLTYEEANHQVNNQHYNFGFGEIVGSPNHHQCVVRPANNQTVANP